jgi:hypothetical protein
LARLRRRAEESFDVRRAVGAAGALFCFSAAPGGQTLLAEFAEQHARSHLMDLAQGFAGYAAPGPRPRPGRCGAGDEASGKLEQDGRELKFVYDDASPEVLAQLISLKSAQHRRTGSVDVMSYGWSRRLLGAVHATRSDSFSGLLSSLWIDGELAAAHFGMRSGGSCTTGSRIYRPEFAAYGPGMILMRELARDGAERGLSEIDLGPGDYRHKNELANGAAPMVGGAVHALTGGRTPGRGGSAAPRTDGGACRSGDSPPCPTAPCGGPIMSWRASRPRLHSPQRANAARFSNRAPSGRQPYRSCWACPGRRGSQPADHGPRGQGGPLWVYHSKDNALRGCWPAAPAHRRALASRRRATTSGPP